MLERKKQSLLRREIDAISTMVAIKALRLAGVSTGQITYAQAVKLYGKWFTEAADAGRIQPCRLGLGTKTTTRWFALDDILSLQAAEIQNVRLNID